MQCQLTMGSYALPLFLISLYTSQCLCQDGWFPAGAYVVTQDALDEAPYRYAKFLDEGKHGMGIG